MMAHTKYIKKSLIKSSSVSSTSPKGQFDCEKVVSEGFFSHFRAFSSSVKGNIL